jgi:hypothetical protein
MNYKKTTRTRSGKLLLGVSLFLFTLILNGCHDNDIQSTPSEMQNPIVITHQTTPLSALTNGRISNNAGNGFVNLDASGGLTYFSTPGACPYMATPVSSGTAGTGFAYSDYFSADFNGDGYTDLICRDSFGSLFYFPWNPTSKTYPSAGSGSNVGNGFNFQSYFIGDFNGDGKSDLIGRNSSGTLYFYPFNNNTFIGQGGGGIVGTGFNNFTHYFIADWDADGKYDIICRNTSGSLYFYPNTNNQFSISTNVGNGFNMIDYYIVEVTGDQFPDLLTKTSSAELLAYPFKSNHSFIGNGGGYSMLFTRELNSQLFFKDFSCDQISDFFEVKAGGLIEGRQCITTNGTPWYFGYSLYNVATWNYQKYFPGYY